MNETDVYLSEIKLALRRCKESEYSEASVRHALELLKEFCAFVKEEDARENLLREMQNLVDKRKAAARREKECENRGWLGESGEGGEISLDEAFPTEKPATGAKAYNVAVIESQRNRRDNALLVYNPFASELVYLAQCYAEKNGFSLRVVDCGKLAETYRPVATKLLNELCGRIKEGEGEAVAYCNLSALQKDEGLEEAFCYYLKKMRMGGKGACQLLLSDDLEYPFELVYKKRISEFYPEEDLLDSLCYGSLSFVFANLPKFEFVKARIREKFALDEWGDGEESFLKKEGVLLGYEGINALLNADSATDWKTLVKTLTARKREAFERFIEGTGENVSCIVEPDWGYKREKRKEKFAPDSSVLDPVFRMPRTAYDGIAGIEEIRERIEKILNAEGVSVLMKCGWAVAYALDGGDTFNLLNVEKERLQTVLAQRWELAYDALAQLMRLPKGELSFDLEEENRTDGQCCDGGRTLRLNRKFLLTTDAETLGKGQETLLHETYHALQHTAIAALNGGNRELLSYYLVHFHIHNHVAAWRDNFSRYRPSASGFGEYYDQVVEAEARIFAADRLAEFAEFNVPKIF